MKLNINLTGRQKAGIMISGIAAITSMVILPVMREKRHEDGQRETPAIEIQDPETVDPEPSKIKAYRSASASSAERVWAELEDARDDPYQAVSNDRQAPKDVGSTPDDVYEDITSKNRLPSGQETTMAEPGSRARGGSPRPGDPGYREYRMRQYYDNADATVRRGEAAKDRIRKASSQDAGQTRPEDPAAVIGDSVQVRRSSAMSSLDTNPGSGFTSLSDDDGSILADERHPFGCMFVRAEKLRDGSRVSVRLLEDMVVGGTLIPKNTHLMAMCAISGRLNLTISSVEMNSRIYQLGYEAYDTDGGKGIYCPDLGGETRRSVRGRSMSSIGRLIGGRMTRLASEAVQTGVSIAQSKSGEVTVSVPSGYRFFIVKKQQ